MKYKVRCILETDLLGTVPKTQEVYDNYIKTRAKGKETRDEFCSPLSEDETQERDAKGWTGFMEEDGKPYVMDYYVRGFLKNAGNTIKDTIGIKNLKSKINNLVFIFPRKIFVSENGGTKRMVCERPLKAMTAQGPRVSLAKSDVIEAGATIEFEVHIPYKCEIKEKHIREMLDYGKYQGFGQWRNGGYGTFSYEMEEIK